MNKVWPILSYSLLFLIFIKLISIDRRVGKLCDVASPTHEVNEERSKPRVSKITDFRLGDPVFCTRGFYAGYYGEVREIAPYSRVVVKFTHKIGPFGKRRPTPIELTADDAKNFYRISERSRYVDACDLEVIYQLEMDEAAKAATESHSDDDLFQ